MSKTSIAHWSAPKEHISDISLKYQSESEWLRPLREYMETDLNRSADRIRGEPIVWRLKE
jgi:hypothetical protein